MAQTGYTPISLYYSTTVSTAPTAGNLANGELAINITDGILFYKDNAGVVQTLATKAATSGTYSSITLSGGTANGVAYLNGSKVVTTGSVLTFNGNTLTVDTSSTPLSLNRSGAGTAHIELKQSGVVGAYIGTSGSNDVIFYNGSASEQMRLNITGLGLGTSSPGYKLDVSGSGIQLTGSGGAKARLIDNSLRLLNSAAIASGYVSFNRSDATQKAAISSYYNVADEGNLEFIGPTGSTNMLLNSSGNLGLGVTPSAWGGTTKNIEGGSGSLNFYSTSQLWLTQNGYWDTGATWRYKANGYATSYQQYTGGHQWFTAPSGTAGNAITFTQAMTLDASGNLLVGATTAGANNANYFEVIGSAAGYIGLGHINGSSSGSVYAQFYYNATGVGSISQNGTTGVLYNIVSDYRLKEVIGAVSGSGERIDALQPIDYTMKSDGSRTRGFLAHKFQEVYPNSVSGEKDAVDADGKPVYQTMQASTSEVIADLVAEIQSLRKRLAAAGI